MRSKYLSVIAILFNIFYNRCVTLGLTRLFLLDVLSFAEVSKARYGFVAEQKRWAKKMLFFTSIRFQSSTPLLYGILFSGHAHQFGIARQTLLI